MRGRVWLIPLIVFPFLACCLTYLVLEQNVSGLLYGIVVFGLPGLALVASGAAARWDGLNTWKVFALCLATLALTAIGVVYGLGFGLYGGSEGERSPYSCPDGRVYC